MFTNYIKMALRNILKHRMYAGINIFGLALGLAVFLFGSLLAEYEQSHDQNFDNHERIFALGSYFSPEAGISVSKQDAVYGGFGGVLRDNVEDFELVVRTMGREFLVGVGDRQFYESVKFTDQAFTQMFNLDYIQGDARVLEDPTSLIVMRSQAEKLFGRTDVLGETVTFDNRLELKVGAVVEDLPQNTHFNSLMIDEQDLVLLGSFDMLESLTEYKVDEDWGNLSMGNNTYLLVPDGADKAWVYDRVIPLFEQHYDEDKKRFISDIDVIALGELNGYIWDMLGVPTFLIVQLLGVLVLVVACINYSNLAIAQSMSRAREVGLRKTLGASRRRLLVQFLTESLTLVTIGLVIAVVFIEAVLPVFNAASGKVMTIDYIPLLPWFLSVVLVVGVVSGIYPAILITRTTPIDALRDGSSNTGRRQWLRSAMIGVQFFFSIALLAAMIVMYLQNQKIRESGNIYPRDEVMVLGRVNVEEIRERHEVMRNRLLALPGVEAVGYSSQVPFQQSNSTYNVTRYDGDQENKFSTNVLWQDHGFVSVYDIPLLSGRSFEESDIDPDGATTVNVLVNRMLAERLGFETPENAVGELFYEGPNEEMRQEHRIVGVVEDQNILGFFNVVKPWVFRVRNTNRQNLSIRMDGATARETAAQVRAIWKEINPDYPIQVRYLGDFFNDIYSIFDMGNKVLASFAGLALTVGLIGLFGVSAFLAERRTREIGLRKVLGAGTGQIVRMMVFQFSIPVLIALCVAIPLVAIGAGAYLNAFADRISGVWVIVTLSGIAALFLAWSVIAGHAMRVARANPIHALRYE